MRWSLFVIAAVSFALVPGCIFVGKPRPLMPAEHAIQKVRQTRVRAGAAATRTKRRAAAKANRMKTRAQKSAEGAQRRAARNAATAKAAANAAARETSAVVQDAEAEAAAVAAESEAAIEAPIEAPVPGGAPPEREEPEAAEDDVRPAEPTGDDLEEPADPGASAETGDGDEL